MPVTTSAQRICSLLPSATEIVCALELGDRLVGVTHECDYPPEVSDCPHVTSSLIDTAALSAGEIDEAVRESLADQAAIYRLDRALLQRLQPDLIITQDLCAVCAVGPDEVEAAVRELAGKPRVVSLDPHTIDEVFDSLVTVGYAAGVPQRAHQLIQEFRGRLDAVDQCIGGAAPIRTLTVEWIDPIFVGGHWVPEMVACAGGYDVLGAAGKPSRQVSWAEVQSQEIDIIVIMLCGFDLKRSMAEMQRAHLPREWDRLPAVQRNDVYVVDGSAYFSRPGPRLIDGIELLAGILHPGCARRGSIGRYLRFSGEPV